MPDFRIFTESKADIKFISDYILEHFNQPLAEADFYALNSWSGYKEDGDIIAAIRENNDNSNQTILILDADNDFAQRRAEVIRDFQRYNIPVNLFLFPNNSLNGNLETMLSVIAFDRKLIGCFEAYEQCIQGYQLPVVKAKIYSYLYALLEPKYKQGGKDDLLKDENRNYRNRAHWDLHHPYLKPLHDFLSPFFPQQY
jgi:hypothetical protein